MFGSKLTGEVVNNFQMTKGNLNSGEKRHKAEKLKDACANSQYWMEGKLRCKCRKRDKELPQIEAIDKVIEKIKNTHSITREAKHWPIKAEEEILSTFQKMFQNTAFNTCTTQELPTMKVKEMDIKIKDGSIRPVNISTPYSVPVAYRKMVYQELQVAERMGIIEAVPPGETSDWCAPMMIVAKKSGGVRLVTNFRTLKKWCKRAPHPTQDTLRQVPVHPSGHGRRQTERNKIILLLAGRLERVPFYSSAEGLTSLFNLYNRIWKIQI